MIQDTAVKVLLGIFSIFAIVIFVVPFLYTSGTFVHLDGSPSVMDHDWSSYGAGGIVYAIGDLICHQESARSFILNGSQMPICIRDVGLLLGLDAGLVCSHLFKKWIAQKKSLIIGAALLLPTVVEWVLEHSFDLDLPELRLMAGIVSGFGAAMIICHLIYRGVVGDGSRIGD